MVAIDTEARGASPVPVLFLGGFGRSGSTLLERIVGELPDVCPVGEVVHLWERGLLGNELCGCGKAFHDCPFWDEVGNVAFGGWKQVDASHVLALKRSVDRNRYVPELAAGGVRGGYRRGLLEYNDLYERLYGAIRQVSGHAVVVDSSKHASLAFCLRASQRIDLRVLHVIRDSRGVAYSWAKAVRRPEATDDSFMPTYSPAQVALLWNAHNSLFGLLRGLGVATMVVPYEQFMTAPRRTVGAIAEFAGIQRDESALSFMSDEHVDLRATHTVAGNPMRFRTGRVPLRRDDDWRRMLAPAHRRVVSALTFPVRVPYRYISLPRATEPI